MSIAIITGATKGIGRACAELCLSKGMRVIGTGRSKATITHQYYQHIKFDVGNRKEIAGFFQQISQQMPNVSLLINNAGLGFPTLFL